MKAAAPQWWVLGKATMTEALEEEDEPKVLMTITEASIEEA